MSTDTIAALAWLPYDFAQMDADLERIRDTLRTAGGHSIGLANAPITLEVIRRSIAEVFALIEPHVEAAVNPS